MADDSTPDGPDRTAPVLTVRSGAVQIVTINRPERRNALDMAERVAARKAIDAASADSDVRVVVLTGAGRVFCSGGDLAAMSNDPAVARVRLEAMGALTSSIVDCRVPVVASVEGGAHGAGLALAAACDLVVAAEDAVLTAAFARVGLTADGGATWALARRVGRSRATAMLLTARAVKGEEAERIGLVDELTAPGEALDRALALAQTLCERAPLSLQATKRLMGSLPADLDAALAAEVDEQSRLYATADFAEGRLAFAERRAAPFEGR